MISNYGHFMCMYILFCVVASVLRHCFCLVSLLLFCVIVFEAQASLKNQKMALLVFLRGAFLGVIGTLLFNEFWCFLKMKVSFFLY